MSFSGKDSGMYAADQPNPYQGDTNEPVKKSSFGCCLWGCLTMFVLVVLTTIAAGVGGYWWLSSTVEKYTSATPEPLPQVEIAPEQLTELQTRVDSFQESVKTGEASEQLILTADELNALIQRDENLKGKVYVVIENGQVSGRISIPADMVPGGKGRYFNAAATFNVRLENGVLIVTCADVAVKGEQLPSAFIEGLSKENLAKDVYKDPEMAELLGRIERLEIVDDKIIIQSRPRATSGNAEPSSKEPENPAPAAEPAAAEPAAAEPAAAEPAAAEPAAAEPAAAAESASPEESSAAT